MKKFPFCYVICAYFMCPTIGTRLDEWRGVKFPDSHYERIERMWDGFPKWHVWALLWIAMMVLWCAFDFAAGRPWW